MEGIVLVDRKERFDGTRRHLRSKTGSKGDGFKAWRGRFESGADVHFNSERGERSSDKGHGR